MGDRVKLPAGLGDVTLTYDGDDSTTHTVKRAKGNIYPARDARDLAALLAIDGASPVGDTDPDPEDPADPDGPALAEQPPPG